MNDCENIRDDSGDPDQSTKVEKGVAQVQSLPHGQPNLNRYSSMLGKKSNTRISGGPLPLECELAVRPTR